MGLIVDAVLVLAAIAAILGGWRRGAVLSAVPMVGLIAGLWIGLTLAPPVVSWIARAGWSGGPVDSIVQRTIVAAVFVGICAAVMYAIAATIAAMIRRRTRKGVARGVDAIAGSLVGLVTWALVVWLIAGFLQTTSLLPVTQLASSSRIVAALNAVAPVPSSSVLGAMDDALGQAGLPKVFLHGGEQVADAPPPDPSIPAAVNAAAAGVVKVLASEPNCGTDSEGSGWVVSEGMVVTNAHVVAAASAVAVQVRGVGRALPARLVVFDPERDLAVLAVPELQAEPLQLGTELAAGASAVVAGFPGDGPYLVTPARVREVLHATGTDIYKQQPVTREIYALRGTVRPGNSGGPLFDTGGNVVGVVFARSTTDADIGFALTLNELRPVLAQAQAGSAVGSGACVAH
ncbi:MAG: MarP family serine protease [Microbacteriaceae bacterium]